MDLWERRECPVTDESASAYNTMLRPSVTPWKCGPEKVVRTTCDWCPRLVSWNKREAWQILVHSPFFPFWWTYFNLSLPILVYDQKVFVFSKLLSIATNIILFRNNSFLKNPIFLFYFFFFLKIYLGWRYYRCALWFLVFVFFPLTPSSKLLPRVLGFYYNK